MASQSLSDSTLISPIQRSFETPGQTKVSGNRQREATHEVCCYTSQLPLNIVEAEIQILNGI